MRKSLKKGIWAGLELVLGGVWGGFWEGFRGFGGLLGNFLASFFHACIWHVLKNALGGFWARFWFDFRGFGKDFWRVLAEILEDSGRFCAILSHSLGFSLLLLAIACFCLF